MNLIGNLYLETRKNKRRFNWLCFLLMILTELFYMSYNLNSPEDRSQGWLLMLYQMPMLNTLFLPAVISVLTSRFTDIEHKEDLFKTLYTFVKPGHLFLTKLLYGMISTALFCSLQITLIFLMGTYRKCPDYPGSGTLIYYFATTFLVCFILYYMQLILSYFISNQAFSICVGLAGSFAGFFSLYLSQGVLHQILPWTLFGLSTPVGADWNSQTRIINFFLLPQDHTLFLRYAVWILLLTLTAVFLLKNSDIEKDIFSQRRHRRHTKPVKIHRVPVEILKLKNSPAWIAFFLLPLISAFIGTVNYTANLGILKQGWYSLWSQHTLFLCYIFMPVAIAVFCSSIWRMEHTGTNMNQLLVNLSARKIVLGKFGASVFISWLSILWIAFLYLTSGKIAGITQPIPAEFMDWILCGAIGSLCICSIQLFFSLVIRSFSLPVILAFTGGFAGLGMTAKWKHPYSIPYSVFSIGMRANNPHFQLNYGAFLASAMVNILLFLFLSIQYIKKTDSRTHE